MADLRVIDVLTKDASEALTVWREPDGAIGAYSQELDLEMQKQLLIDALLHIQQWIDAK